MKLEDWMFWKPKQETKPLLQRTAKKTIEVEGKKLPVTPGASSVREVNPSSGGYEYFNTGLKILNPPDLLEGIPIIRQLCRVNPDFSQALNDQTRLANTGHQVFFDQKVDANQRDEMRQFLTESSKGWHVGAAGMDSIINKMFRQLMIGGALSTECIPNLSLTNLEEIRFIAPETIRFAIDKNYKGYQPYQKIKNVLVTAPGKDLRKLNNLQFKYFALNGDLDTPYGYPPFFAALDSIKTQRHMLDNIKFIIETLGVLGFLDAKIDKPEKTSGESDEAYISRMTTFLGTFRDRVQQGLRDGVSVGFTDEHEYDFKTTAKTAAGVQELFEMNELMVASGLNYDAAFMGRPGSTETLITILFTKMIAQLTNYQSIVRENLEFMYKLALTLGGYQFKTIKVKFNKSTITDDLKYQQAEEIKLRNCVIKYQMGIIGQEQFADEMGYSAPDKSEPRIDINNVDPGSGEVKRKKREEGKDASDKKSRDKKKPQGQIKKGKNR